MPSYNFVPVGTDTPQRYHLERHSGGSRAVLCTHGEPVRFLNNPGQPQHYQPQIVNGEHWVEQKTVYQAQPGKPSIRHQG